ncbi:MFS transporter [Vibrio profundum]|uniref:MFS transporter n=1 Tax=Vibrio profundum TaxID=2910247 RepID=UPI003D14FAA8
MKNKRFLSSMTNRTQQIRLCLLVHFFIALDSIIVIPLGTDMARSCNVLPNQAGYFTASYALTAALVGFLLRRKVRYRAIELKIGFVGLMVSTYALTMTNQFIILLVFRALAGVCAGALAVMNFNRLLALSSDEDRKANIGALLSVFPLTLSMAVPPCLFIASHWGWQRVFEVMALAMLALLILLGYKAKNVTPSALSNANKLSDNGPQVRYTKTFIFCVLAVFLAVFSTFLVSTQFPIRLIAELDIPNLALSLSYILGGLGCFYTLKRHTMRSGEGVELKTILVLSLCMALVTTIGLLTSNDGIGMSMFCVFLVASASRTLIINTDILCLLDIEQRSELIGIQGALQQFAMASAGAAGSYLSSMTWGLPTHGAWPYLILVIVASIFMLLVPVLCKLISVGRRRKLLLGE